MRPAPAGGRGPVAPPPGMRAPPPARPAAAARARAGQTAPAGGAAWSAHKGSGRAGEGGRGERRREFEGPLYATAGRPAGRPLIRTERAARLTNEAGGRPGPRGWGWEAGGAAKGTEAEAHECRAVRSLADSTGRSGAVERAGRHLSIAPDADGPHRHAPLLRAAEGQPAAWWVARRAGGRVDTSRRTTGY